MLLRTAVFTVLLGAGIGAGAPLLAQGRVATGNDGADDARSEGALAKAVSVDLRHVSRKQAIDALSKTANILIQYRVPVLAAYTELIDVRVEKKSLAEALERVLDGTSLRAVPDGKLSILIVESNPAATDSLPNVGEISGTVIDSSSQQPLTNVVVSVVGTRLSAATGPNGRFMFPKVPVGERTLAFKLLGFSSTTRSIVVDKGQPIVIRVVMTPSATMLNEVVTTATGRQRRMEVGNDITTIRVDSILSHAPISSVTDLLESRVPGITIVHTSGEPGDPSRIRLRGAQSINGSNAPIVVIDGVRAYYPEGNANPATTYGGASVAGGEGRQYARPSPLDQIDVNSIETIDVLRGPSASALYGSDAANGVIVVTTKRGQSGDTHWSVSLDQGTSTIPGKYSVNYFPVSHSLNGVPSIYGCTQPGLACFVDSIIAFQALNDENITPLGRGWTSKGSATVSGGTRGLTYSFTGGAGIDRGLLRLPSSIERQYENRVGSTPPSWMRRPDLYRTWNFTSALGAKLGSSATLNLTNMLSNSMQRRSSLGLNRIAQLASSYVDTLTEYSFTTYHNPLAGFNERATADTRTSTTAAALDWRVKPWFPLNVTLGTNTNDNADIVYTPSGLPEEFYFSPSRSSGAYSVARQSVTQQTVNASSELHVPFPRSSHLNVVTGANYQKQTLGSVVLSGTGIPIGVDNPMTFTSASGTQGTLATSTYGWFAEPRIALAGNKYLTPGIRFDRGGSSGSLAGFLPFPKLDGSWVVLDRTEDQSAGTRASWLTMLRLRGAYGFAGVQPSPGARLRLFERNAVTVDGGNSEIPAIGVKTLGNTKLRPERSSQLETGFDTDILDGRLTAGWTYFYKLRRDAIIDVGVAPSVSGNGVSSYALNVGSIRSRGLELSAQVRLIDLRSTQWSIDAQTSSRDDRLLRLARGVDSIRGNGGTRVTPGYPLFGFWGRPIAAYADLNGNGVIENAEVTLADHDVYLGSSDPNYTASVGTNLVLFNGRITFAARTNYQNGLTQYDGSSGAIRSAANAPDATPLQQAIAAVSAMSGGNTTPYYQYQTVNMLRLESVSLGYQVPARVAQMFKARAMSIAIQGGNVYLHTNYRGKDPNVNSFATGNVVQDFGQLPQPRVWELHVSLSK